jgi:hypothetical protein
MNNDPKTPFLFSSSYILVMISMDRFQAICYPMTNHFWQPSRSKLKIVIAWIIALVFCIPQAIIFGEVTEENHARPTCSAQFGAAGEKSAGEHVVCSCQKV